MNQGAALNLRSFDELTAARKAAVMLAGSGMLSPHERDHVLGVMEHITQALALKRERGDAGRELESLRERWPDWDFRMEGEAWIGCTKDGLCILRSEFLAALKNDVKREEEIWVSIHGHKKMEG